MKGLGRNIKYWSIYCAKTIGLVWLMMAGIVAVTSFFDGDFQLMTFCSNLALYLAMSCVLLTFVYAFTNITTIFPITISNGTRRVSSLAGMIIVQHIFILLGMTISGVLLGVCRPGFFEVILSIWPLALGLFFAMMGLSCLIAVLCTKLGRVIGIILYIIVVIGSVVLISFGFISNSFDALALISMFGMIGILVGGLVFDVVMSVLLYLVNRNTEIKYA